MGKETVACITGALAAIFGTLLTASLCDKVKHKTIPSVSEVQQGYVIPSKLEIMLKDLDGNGQKEVLIKYAGKDYLFTLDEKGKPRVQTYELKYEVVPNE